MDLEAVNELGCTFGLSLEERAVLEVLFEQKRLDEKLSSIKFWGRIAGTRNDYLIAAALRQRHEGASYVFYYCATGSGQTSLVPLPEIVEEHRAKNVAAGNGRFLGVPGKLLGADAEAPEEEEEEEAEEEEPAAEEGEEELEVEEGNPVPRHAAPPRAAKVKPVRFSEAHRLAWTVHAIACDTSLVPAGAFLVSPNRTIEPNPSFGGVGPSACGGLEPLLHFRPPRDPARAQALARGSLLGHSDWLDPASEDAPGGMAWAVRKEAAQGTGKLRVTARSLKWPGAVAWHAVGGPGFGHVYAGDGTRNDAACFML